MNEERFDGEGAAEHVDSDDDPPNGDRPSVGGTKGKKKWTVDLRSPILRGGLAA